MKQKTPGLGTPRVVSLQGVLSKVFPFVKVQRRDLPLLVTTYEDELTPVRSSMLSPTPDFPLIVMVVPRIIALVHSIAESGHAIVRVHGSPGNYDLHFDFPELPLPIELEGAQVVPSPMLENYVTWSGRAMLTIPVVEWKGSVHLYLERLLELASYRYARFNWATWSEFITDFCQNQAKRCSQEILSAVVRDTPESDLSALNILRLHDELYDRIDDKVQRMFRELLGLDPTILASWMPKPTPDVQPTMVPGAEPSTIGKKKVPRKKAKLEPV